ncbi:translation initiation factor eIF3 core subunit j Ecym_4711 [Eremothecium cymbalariae DBVPG|uniref:Eukaryotic translation initiation factor 3 subunit J n=1 Tax=Eremothecium cymbalariae (strain CBS 270.75 / DBVPG 7215 / KCTC 17166 / NRRL Y-17582) TaxID=931890 RepID=G8JSK9_ERECY|nr:hypothetical protein Ecym_4711 [Eremothecium cymbalariae DBVPG\
MSWDDNEFEVPDVAKDQPIVESWDDDFRDDGEEALLESWDAEEKEVSKPKKKAVTVNKERKSVDKVLLDIDTLDEKTRKELLRKAELDSDLNNAADLFGGLGVAEEHPRARALRKEQDLEESLSKPAGFTKQTPFETHPLFVELETKADYQELRKALSSAITGVAKKSQLNYSSALAIDLIRDVAKPLSIESIKQSVATLNLLIREKEKQERQARLSKVKGGTATGGAGKKKAKTARPNLGGAFKKDQEFALDNADYGDFDDGDFM